MTAPEPGIRAASEELIEGLAAAVVTVNFVIETLLSLPAGALPGEDRSAAMRELLIASARCEVEAAGEDACRAAAALLEAVVARMADDAIATAELAGMSGQRLC